MERKIIMVCVLVAVLGIAAAAAGFAAEATRVKKSYLSVDYVECEYKSSPTTGFAIAATVALVLARVIITSATGGCCSRWVHIISLPRFARICVVISSITATVAVILFTVGGILSSLKGVQTDVDVDVDVDDGGYYCYGVRPGIFSGAAILTLLSVLLSLVYDLAFASATNVVFEASELELGVEVQPITDEKNPRKPSKKM